MRELSSVLRQHAFHLLLLFIAVIVFCKPILLVGESERASGVVLELFVPWAMVVVVLFLIGRSGNQPRAVDAQSGGEAGGEAPDQADAREPHEQN